MKTFLVLEDEPFISMDLKFAFEDAGHNAVCAVDNDEALACIEAHDIAGAVLDVSLGGGRTCEQTATRLNELSIPFVLHTGDLDRAGEHLRGLDAPVLAKPRPAEDVVSHLVRLTRQLS
ncbi:response regulator [Altererythrobacter sp. B11]|uniref:response regulator n=1 Tax=Altererythrobacter sp. B11 TaxID=2060312 RepID=UPI000DC6D7DC|nr:response regulator [Altererythrobacter sp. B11]BBC71131.1 response regulator [Altererythrobacter sp. B11]